MGTDASLAGIQNSDTASIRKEAISSQASVRTTGMEANRPNRRMSQTTIVRRRSNRSAMAPASGPSRIAGSRRKTSTPPMAKDCPE